MNQNWAEAIILIAVRRPVLLRPGLRDELSRTFFAFSRDRAVPGWKMWSRVSGKRGVPLAAVVCSCALVFLLMVPALPGRGPTFPRSPSSRPPRSARSGSTSPTWRRCICAGARAIVPGALVDPGAEVQVDQRDRRGLRHPHGDHPDACRPTAPECRGSPTSTGASSTTRRWSSASSCSASGWPGSSVPRTATRARSGRSSSTRAGIIEEKPAEPPPPAAAAPRRRLARALDA